MGFKKAAPQQARFKAGFYGKAGSGKTLTSLLVAEGLALRDGKRIAYVDTEGGTDFYAMDVLARTVHPKAIDFDAIYTRSIYEVIDAIKGLDTSVHGVVVIDSITHLWEAAQSAYAGKRMSNGQIPIHAWGEIKKPYKQLMSLLLDGNFHSIICGREGVTMDKDEDGAMEVTGTKMKAEGETAHEPNILARFAPDRSEDGGYVIQAFFEKDRSGILTGQTVKWPNYATFEPIVRLLSGDYQRSAGGAGDSVEQDVAAAAAEVARNEAERVALMANIKAALESAKTPDALKAAWSLTIGKKTKLGAENFDALTAIKDACKAAMASAMVEV